MRRARWLKTCQFRSTQYKVGCSIQKECSSTWDGVLSTRRVLLSMEGVLRTRGVFLSIGWDTQHGGECFSIGEGAQNEGSAPQRGGGCSVPVVSLMGQHKDQARREGRSGRAVTPSSVEQGPALAQQGPWVLKHKLAAA